MKPIIFNTAMVKAILDGKKTSTRRPIKPQPELMGAASGGVCPGFRFLNIPGKGPVWDHKPYKPGDTLYVRETWVKADDGYHYKAGFKDTEGLMKAYGYKWHPSIHMPKDAARIFLKVTDVRTERLQNISQLDIEKEGLWYYSQEYRNEICINRDSVCGLEYTRKKYFQRLWDSIYGKQGYGWNNNPWVWVIEFERDEIDKNDGLYWLDEKELHEMSEAGRR